MKSNFQKLGMLLMLLGSSWGIALAQYDVSGKVTNAGGEPLTGVTVAVKNTNNGTTTDVDGMYSLNISGSSATIVFSYVGFRSQEKQVNGASTSLNISLEETSSELDEVVVSGLATTVKRKNAANNVASIPAKDLTGITSQSTLDGALSGKFTGAQISSNSGAPGGGMTFRLRGVTSINAPAQPLFIIDGVYVDNSSIAAGLNVVSDAAGGGSTAQYDQDNPSNRIADIDPGDIENVEILKGASAAALYGSRAAGGVVIITTKKGKQSKGGANISFTQSLGVNTISHPLGLREWDPTKVESYYGPDEVAVYNAAVASGQYYNYEDELYGNSGFVSDSRLSVGGGNERTTFYTSMSHRNEDGIVNNTGYTKTSLRLNVTHQVNKRIDISMYNNFLRTSADRGFFNNDNTSTTMGISYAATPPWAELHPDAEGNYPNNNYSASNFLQTSALITNNELTNRYIGGASATIKLLTNDQHSLKLVMSGGVDAFNYATTAIFPRELQFEKDGNGTNGASIQGSTNVFNNNESAFLVYSFYPAGKDLNLTTTGGLTRESFSRNTIIVTATQLIGTQTNVDQSGAVVTDQFVSNQLDLGGFAQEEVNYKDMVIASLGFRADKSSNNSDANKLYFYPKANLALNISEMSFWSIDKWNTFKLRVAYGQSSNFPPAESKYTSLNSTLIDGTAGSIINAQAGNSSIGPERQAELETGFDLGFLDNKINFDFTYYVKNVTDLLLIAQTPGSSGYGSKWINGADLRNTGVEIGLGIEIVKTKDFSWFNQTNFWLNRSEITRLDIPAYNTGGFGATLGTYRIEEGQSATQIVGIGADSLDTNGDGLVVWGDYEPDFQVSFQEDLKWKNWQLSILLHWKKGGDNINLSSLLTDIFGTSYDYDATDLDPNGALSNGDYRLSLLGTSAQPWVEDAGYVRIREIGLYYTIDNLSEGSNGFIRSIQLGISAYKPFSWFKYHSYDPEVSNFGSNGISNGVEVTPYPSSKSYYFTATLNF